MKWMLLLKSMHICTLYNMFNLRLLMGRKGPFCIHDFSQMKILDSSWILKSQIYLCTSEWSINAPHMSSPLVRFQPCRIIYLCIHFSCCSHLLFLFSKMQKWTDKLQSLDLIMNSRHPLISFLPSGKSVHFVDFRMPNYLDVQALLRILLNTAWRSLAFPVHNNVTAKL